MQKLSDGFLIVDARVVLRGKSNADGGTLLAGFAHSFSLPADGANSFVVRALMAVFFLPCSPMTLIAGALWDGAYALTNPGRTSPRSSATCRQWFVNLGVSF